MAKSIMQQDKRCYLCGRVTELECHHVMSGPNRKWSEKYGLTVMLCREHHTGDTGVHKNRDKADALKRLAQIAFEARHSREEWMQIFRKNYL